MKIKLLASILLILSQTTQISHAQDGATLLLSQYMSQNPDYIAQINLKSEQIFKLSFPKCAGEISKQRLKPTITGRLDFNIPQIDSDGNDIESTPFDIRTMHPSYGQWIDKTIVTGCDEATQINFLVTSFSHDKLPLIYPQLNGQTKIDIKFQAAAEKTIRDEIALNGKCSSNQFVTSTGFIGYKDKTSNKLTKDDNNAGWFEKWAVYGCEKTHLINLAILPDPKTRYRFIAKIIK